MISDIINKYITIINTHSALLTPKQKIFMGIINFSLISLGLLSILAIAFYRQHRRDEREAKQKGWR